MFGLMVMLLLLILGMGFLGKQADAYRSATQAVAGQVAMECAMAGLEDARVKLMNDGNFPPSGDENQQQFTYTEVLKGLDGTDLGTYTVTVDSRWMDPPVEIYKVDVVGRAGPPDAPPTLARRVSVEFDLAEVRGGSPNPNQGRFINFWDHGGL